MTSEDQLQQRMQKIAVLVQELDSGDARLRAKSKELVEAVMDLHGEAVERMLDRLRNAGEAGEAILEGLANDPVVSSVLLLYGLHPMDLETRVRRAVERVRPTLHALGAEVELTGASELAVRLQVRGVNNAFTARTVRSAIEDELYGAAPDVQAVVVSGLENFAAPDFVPLEKVGVLTAGKAGD